MNETWSHWCYDQQLTALPAHTPKCPQCGALDLSRARFIPPRTAETRGEGS